MTKLVFLLGCLALLAPSAPTHAAARPALAFLGVHFQNDNAGLEAAHPRPRRCG